MTPKELAAKLKSMYDSAGTNEKLVTIHLFGILYAKQMENCGAPVTQIANMAFPEKAKKAFPKNVPYHAEVSKGRSLARYVQLKKEWADHF